MNFVTYSALLAGSKISKCGKKSGIEILVTVACVVYVTYFLCTVSSVPRLLLQSAIETLGQVHILTGKNGNMHFIMDI